jgi:hypothetical protein
MIVSISQELPTIARSEITMWKSGFSPFYLEISCVELNADYANAYCNLGMIKYLSATNKVDKESGMADVRKSAELYKKQGEETKVSESAGLMRQMQQDLTKITLAN